MIEHSSIHNNTLDHSCYKYCDLIGQSRWYNTLYTHFIVVVKVLVIFMVISCDEFTFNTQHDCNIRFIYSLSGHFYLKIAVGF